MLKWLFPLLVTIWLIMPKLIQFLYPLSGMIDAGILQLIGLGFACWLLALSCAMLLSKPIHRHFTLLLVQDHVAPLTSLTSWQQHVLYLAFYAVLVLSATGCLIAIC
ncbi:hypothetical protein ACFQ1J_12665 [Pedobacter boryungensis]